MDPVTLDICWSRLVGVVTFAEIRVGQG